MLIFHEVRIPEFLLKTVKVLSVTAREKECIKKEEENVDRERDRKGEFTFLNWIILYFPKLN